MYHIDRIDFIPAGKRCNFCSRELKSRVSYILRDEKGTEFLSGPTCLTTHAKVDKSKETYPNFAKACQGDMADHKEPKKEGERKPRSKTKEGNEAIEYLVLRFRLLGSFPGMRIKSLEEMYERYVKGGQLTEDDRKHLGRLIAKVTNERPEYSPRNLTACYAYSHWIKIALQDLPADKQSFLRSMLFAINKNLYLSPAQAAAVNRWFVKIEGAPALDPAAFVAARPKQQGSTTIGANEG